MPVAQPPPVIAPEKPLTRFQAQRNFGLMAHFDYGFIGVILFSWITLGFWKFFGDPTPINLIALAILNLFIMQLWIVLLIYRVLVWLLDTNADINLMPEAAARIVLGFWEGRTK